MLFKHTLAAWVNWRVGGGGVLNVADRTPLKHANICSDFAIWAISKAPCLGILQFEDYVFLENKQSWIIQFRLMGLKPMPKCISLDQFHHHRFLSNLFLLGPVKNYFTLILLFFSCVLESNRAGCKTMLFIQDYAGYLDKFSENSTP